MDGGGRFKDHVSAAAVKLLRRQGEQSREGGKGGEGGEASA